MDAPVTGRRERDLRSGAWVKTVHGSRFTVNQWSDGHRWWILVKGRDWSCWSWETGDEFWCETLTGDQWWPKVTNDIVWFMIVNKLVIYGDHIVATGNGESCHWYGWCARVWKWWSPCWFTHHRHDWWWLTWKMFNKLSPKCSIFVDSRSFIRQLTGRALIAILSGQHPWEIELVSISSDDPIFV